MAKTLLAVFVHPARRLRNSYMSGLSKCMSLGRAM